MTLVNRLSLTTVVYSSGPVTPWMWKVVTVGPWPRQKPRSAHMPGGLDEDVDRLAGEESSSPVAATYWVSA